MYTWLYLIQTFIGTNAVQLRLQYGNVIEMYVKLLSFFRAQQKLQCKSKSLTVEKAELSAEHYLLKDVITSQ